MPQYHAPDCWCETCKRFRARIEALEAEVAAARALVDLAVALLLAGGCPSSAVTLAERRTWATEEDLAEVTSRSGVSRGIRNQ